MTCLLISGVWCNSCLQHLNEDVRHNNNALKEFNDCIGGLLHLGLNVIILRTLLHLGQLLHLGLQQMSPSAGRASRDFWTFLEQGC